MLHRRGGCIAAAAAGVLVVGLTGASAAEPTVQELQAQVKNLQTKMDAMEAKQAQNSADVATTVDAVLRDAERRSKLLMTGGDMTAGYDNGFFIANSDHSFFFHPWVQLQARGVANYREETKPSGGSDTETGFEIRRAKIGFDGNLFSKDLTYQFIWATNRADSVDTLTDSAGNTVSVNTHNGGSPILEEAWAKYNFTDQWAFKFGQYKDPFFHEGVLSSKKQLAVERSYIGDVIALGDNFIQGISLIYADQGPLRAELAVTDGTKSNNTNFRDPPNSSANFGVAGRVDYRLMGNKWSEYDDFTALGNKEDLLVVGAAADWTQTGDTDVILHTVDVQWENTGGLGIFAAYLGRYTGAAKDSTLGDTYDYGGLAQVGYLVNSNWEIFARYGYMRFDDGVVSAGASRDFHELTGGVNYYWHGHTAKFTVDLSWLPKGAPFDDTSGDILKSLDDKDEILLRGQFQLLI